MPARKSQGRAGELEGSKQETVRLAEWELAPQTHGVKPPAAGNAGCEWQVEELKPKEGIERELKVIRVGPNPRMVVCEYWELAQRRTCVVNVGNGKKWLKGMVFKMVEPLDEEEYRRAWVYRGRAPRRKGRW